MKHGRDIFSSPPAPNRLWGPDSLLSDVYQMFFPQGIKRPGRKANQSPPYNTEVKNAWRYISTPPMSLHGVVLN